MYTLPVDLIHQSKISIPPVTGIPRPRLVERIEQAAQGKLTVVSAPAGWGKSTLLAEWASQSALNVAWISLDEGDRNPTRYFRSLVAALDHIYPMQLDDVFAMLRSPTPAIDDQIDQAILTRLADMPERTAIVFDDFHVLTQPEFLRSFCRVLEYLPPSLHFIVATRGEIQIPLARLRSAGVVTVLRSEDLAFSIDEANSILAGMSTPTLDMGDVRQLVDRTEGWVAGLRIAGITLANQGDPHTAIDRLRGTHRDFADYFQEEVLDRLDPDLRIFLLESSALHTLSESLCNEVTSRSDADAMLARIAGADLFLIPLDQERSWYRYHGLFREMLQAGFARLPEARRIEIHRRASRWYERHMMFNEAVEHAIAANDLDCVAAIVDRFADTLMFECGDTNELVSWIELLPDDLLHRRPGLLRVYAWALTTIGRIDHAERTMHRVSDRYLALGASEDSQEGRERDAELAAVNARIAAYRGDHRATIVHGQRALELLDPMRHGRVYGDVVLSIGFSERALGNTETAADAFAEAARLGRQHGNVQAARWGARYLAVTRMSQGRLHEAEAIVDEDLERVRQESRDPGSMLSALLISKAEILLERNRLAESRSYLERALPLVQAVGDAKMLMNVYVTLGLLLKAEGEELAAREKIRRSEEVFPTANRGARLAMLALMQGNIAEAQRWARLSGFSLDDEADPLRGEYEQIAFARIMALTEPSAASLGLVERLVRDAEDGGRYGRVIEILAIQAVAFARLGNHAQARASLCRSLVHARHEGFVRTYLDLGPDMRNLLRDLVRERTGIDEPTRVFALELLSQFSGDTVSAPSTVPGLDEALTARQLEILELLAAGQSNRDIANRLYIAEGTVKAHMHQLFGKLMARNRTEAVANARDLNLIA